MKKLLFGKTDKKKNKYELPMLQPCQFLIFQLSTISTLTTSEVKDLIVQYNKYLKLAHNKFKQLAQATQQVKEKLHVSQEKHALLTIQYRQLLTALEQQQLKNQNLTQSMTQIKGRDELQREISRKLSRQVLDLLNFKLQTQLDRMAKYDILLDQDKRFTNLLQIISQDISVKFIQQEEYEDSLTQNVLSLYKSQITSKAHKQRKISAQSDVVSINVIAQVDLLGSLMTQESDLGTTKLSLQLQQLKFQKNNLTKKVSNLIQSLAIKQEEIKKNNKDFILSENKTKLANENAKFRQEQYKAIKKTEQMLRQQVLQFSNKYQRVAKELQRATASQLSYLEKVQLCQRKIVFLQQKLNKFSQQRALQQTKAQQNFLKLRQKDMRLQSLQQKLKTLKKENQDLKHRLQQLNEKQTLQLRQIQAKSNQLIQQNSSKQNKITQLEQQRKQLQTRSVLINQEFQEALQKNVTQSLQQLQSLQNKNKALIKINQELTVHMNNSVCQLNEQVVKQTARRCLTALSLLGCEIKQVMERGKGASQGQVQNMYLRTEQFKNVFQWCTE